jgi:COP9 signalosome complex subunit 4
MFLDRILRPYEVKEFESTLKPHQLAKIGKSSRDRVMVTSQLNTSKESIAKRVAPETVLDRAVMEHNLLSCSRIYNNITFSGLGDLLDLSATGAETMARRMIEQKRLRGSIDQIARLLWFEGSTDMDDAQGKAGGLGEIEHAEDTGAPATKVWDRQIRQIASSVGTQCLLSWPCFEHNLSGRKYCATFSRKKLDCNIVVLSIVVCY